MTTAAKRMTGTIRPRAIAIAGGFAAGLILIGVLRSARGGDSTLASLAAFATPLYVALTIFAGLRLVRAGAPFSRFGFGGPHRPGLYVGLALLAVIALQATSALLEPVWVGLFGGGRDLGRFAGIAGSPEALGRLLLLNWTVAAFGEEIAFRIVLMQGLAYALGGSRYAVLAALLLQAVVFGLVHLYQGPAGVAATTVNGLVYGAVVVAARGSIWPAALAHGISNTIGILELYHGG